MGYWCKGSPSAQLEPCAPGMEERSAPLNENGTFAGKPVEGSIVIDKPTAPAPSSTEPVYAPADPAADADKENDKKKRDKETLKEGQASILKLLGFGLVFGLVAKVLGRSFWRWFVLGALLRIVLVSLNLMKY